MVHTLLWCLWGHRADGRISKSGLLTLESKIVFMIIRFVIVCSFLFFGGMSFASFAKSDLSSDLIELEAEIVDLQEQLKSSKTDQDRLAYHDSLRQVMMAVLSIEESFEYPFSMLKYMAVLTSDDKLMRIFNWNVPLENGTHMYGAFLMWKTDKRKNPELFWTELTPIKEDGTSLTNKYMKPEAWKGALYYDLITVDYKRDKYYMLLGWDGANNVINRKVIEVVTLNKDKVRFGAPVFKMEKSSPKRFIMEYSEEVSASLKFRKDENRIVFDHLAPRAQGLEGNPAFYGPDLTFDAFVFEKGNWVFESNVYVTMGKDDAKRPYIDPRRIR